MNPVRTIVAQVLSLFPTTAIERLSTHSLLRHEFRALRKAAVFKTRESLWDYAVERIGSAAPIMFLEFGVWRGRSMRHFASKFTSPNSRFVGFDSFEGLPDDWTDDTPKGTFTTGGKVPDISDPRVTFVVGTFQQQYERIVGFLANGRSENLLIHYDADLYSSTLFLLTAIDRKIDGYWCIFDEFTSDEARALHHYVISYGAQVEFLAVTKTRYPVRVLARIRTSLATQPVASANQKPS